MKVPKNLCSPGIRKSFGCLLVCLLCLFLPVSRAQAAWDFAFFWESTLNPTSFLTLENGSGPSHGFVFLQYTDLHHVGPGNRLRIGLNTDTVWASLDLGASSASAYKSSLYVLGQFGFAEMTPDYIQAGLHVKTRSFSSFFTELGYEGSLRVAPSVAIRARLGGRFWWFSTQTLAFGDSAAQSAFVLPANSPGFRSELAMTWGAFDTWVLRGRLRKGFRGQLVGMLRARVFNPPWGGFLQDPKDQRNSSVARGPARLLALEMEGAVLLHPRISLELGAFAGMSWGADDLQRFKLGGDNPYVQQISGTYFAEFVVDAYLLGRVLMHFVPWDFLRITPQFDIAMIQDPLRNGSTMRNRWIAGFGLGIDFFLFDNMRIFLKFSASPNAPRPERDGSFKAMLGFVAHWWPAKIPFVP